jgi:tyrosyl-tRNA synthetase
VIKSKLKKSFCEPGNIDFCPPIALAKALIWDRNASSGDEAATTLKIVRPPDHGGDKEYESVEQVQQDFAQGEAILHPGDLKAGVSTIMVEVMSQIADAIKSDKEAFQESKVLKDFKKLSKGKK